MINDEIVLRDKFGNQVSVIELNDSRLKKVTQSNRYSDFEFMEETYSYDLLVSAETVKQYWDENHSVRKLIKDKHGRLFHYRYDEEMCFDGGADREDFLWTLVGSITESDNLSQLTGLSLLIEPFIAGDETGWMSVHEFVDKDFVEKHKRKSNLLSRIIDMFFKDKN